MPLSPALVVLIVAVPIDDSRTRIYLRSYQRLVLAPMLSAFVGWLLMRVHRIILREDRRIVESQPRGDSLLASENALLDFDEPVSAFRSWRRQRLEERRRRQLTTTPQGTPQISSKGRSNCTVGAKVSVVRAEELAEEA
jgi:phenylpropionate dioxygenase-like ring-hydroxylating dioxygenase large terminal subunit